MFLLQPILTGFQFLIKLFNVLCSLRYLRICFLYSLVFYWEVFKYCTLGLDLHLVLLLFLLKVFHFNFQANLSHIALLVLHFNFFQWLDLALQFLNVFNLLSLSFLFLLELRTIFFASLLNLVNLSLEENNLLQEGFNLLLTWLSSLCNCTLFLLL